MTRRTVQAPGAASDAAGPPEALGSPEGPRFPPIHLMTGGAGPQRRVRFAGGVLVTDRHLAALKGLPGLDDPDGSGPARRTPPTGSLSTGGTDSSPDTEGHHLPALFDGRGWVAGEERRVACRGGGDLFHIAVEDHSRIRVERLDDRVEVEVTWLANWSEANLDAVVSAPVVLGLALTDRYCLHASSAAHAGSAWLFPGDSDAGKSTLARELDRLGGWHRLTDDISPVCVADGRVWLLPHFTQPRLAASEHAAPEDHLVPVAGIGLLDAEWDPQAVKLGSLGGPQAALELVRHTVGTRVFDRPLRARHLRACAELCAAVPVVQLAYPRRLDAVPDAARALADRQQSAG